MTIDNQPTTRGMLQTLWRDRTARRSAWVILAYFAIAILSGLHLLFPNVGIVHYDQSFLPPSLDHLFGTDIFGRDVLAKAVHASRTAIYIGFTASFIAIPLGTLLGALGGYFGGWVDDLVVWIYSTVDSVPSILLVIALAYSLGPGLTNTYISIGMTCWVPLCRLIRGEFLKQKERDYVSAAEAMGASHSRRIFLHILPNTLHLVLIQFSLTFVYAIKSEVILSFLGLGAETGQFSWGLMIEGSRQRLSEGVWWELACATIFMFGIILAFNLFNESVADALDPKRRK